jgi:hypothetical protein
MPQDQDLNNNNQLKAALNLLHQLEPKQESTNEVMLPEYWRAWWQWLLPQWTDSGALDGPAQNIPLHIQTQIIHKILPDWEE